MFDCNIFLAAITRQLSVEHNNISHGEGAIQRWSFWVQTRGTFPACVCDDPQFAQTCAKVAVDCQRLTTAFTFS